VLLAWIASQGIGTALIDPGKPWQNDTDRFDAAEKGPVNFAILTMPTSEVMRPIHDRMPVMLRAERAKSWLSTQGVPFFNPLPAELMTAYHPARKPHHLQRAGSSGAPLTGHHLNPKADRPCPGAGSSTPTASPQPRLLWHLRKLR
jgi:SOS response associated peptidase (SRAP)